MESKRVKTIYLEPAFRLHSLYRELVQQPPEGYEFITSPTLWDKTFEVTNNRSLQFWHYLHDSKTALDRVIPIVLAKSYFQRYRHERKDIDLTFAAEHIVFNEEPFICYFEHVSVLIGDPKYFKRYAKFIEKAFSSQYCKKIVCQTEMASKAVRLNLNCSNFEQKIDYLHIPAVTAKKFIKNYSHDKIKLLFVGSANIPREFEHKGGKEVLEAFVELKKRYPALELVIRSDMPPVLKSKYQDIENLKIFDKIMPWEEIEQEFMSADIFLFPSHTTPALAFLDAMSYELPVITTDVWANPEIIKDGRTGIVIEKSANVPYYRDNYILNWGTPEFISSISKTDPKVVRDLITATSMLIDNEDLRRQMGKAGRWEVEKGRYSIAKRNEKLKNILDEATA